jgi:DNA-binding transcriptional LysR family regulator
VDLRAQSFRYFVLLAEELSFTRAAERGDVTQSAISMRIRDMEQQLGIKLFHRSTRAVTLTEEGAELFEQARRVLAETDRFQAICAQLRESPETPLLIAAPVYAIGSERWMPLVEKFRVLEPRIQVRLSHHASRDIIMAVQDGRADIGIVAGHPPVSMERLVIGRFQLGLAVPEEWGIARKPRLTRDDLNGVKLAAFDRDLNPVLYDEVLERLRELGMILVPSPEGLIGGGFAERERIASIFFSGYSRDSIGMTLRPIPLADIEITMPLCAVRNQVSPRRSPRLFWEFVRQSCEAMTDA